MNFQSEKSWASEKVLWASGFSYSLAWWASRKEKKINFCSPSWFSSPGAWLLAGVLYAWQFPHFNALSWNLRPDYSRAGYRMMSVVNPGLTKRVALRYCLVTTGLCVAAPLIDLTTWTFAADSLPLNLYLSYLAWNFYRHGDSKSSRKLFRFTLIHLPFLLILMWISKKPRKSSKAGEAEKVAVVADGAAVWLVLWFVETTNCHSVLFESLIQPVFYFMSVCGKVILDKCDVCLLWEYWWNPLITKQLVSSVLLLYNITLYYRK